MEERVKNLKTWKYMSIIKNIISNKFSFFISSFKGRSILFAMTKPLPAISTLRPWIVPLHNLFENNYF